MSPSTLELADVARNYCELIESSSEDSTDWIANVARLLPKIHAVVTSMGHASFTEDHVMVVDLDARFELFTHLRELLGNKDAYWMEFDVAEDGQSMSGSLADDLTDIYCELKHILKVMDGEPTKAEEQILRGFQVHWGKHLLDAERHLYELRARGELSQ